MQSLKSRFDIPEHVHYLNAAYMTPFLKSQRETGHAVLDRMMRPYELSVEDFFSGASEIKRLISEILKCDDAERIALMPSVSYGVSTIAANTSLDASHNIVLVDEQFPSNVYAWKAAAARSGAHIRFAARPANFETNWSDDILACIDDNTRIVALGHVHWTDGYVFDLERISSRIRETGGLLVIDGTQSLGAFPFPFEIVKPDAFVCAGYKWLLGPYSTAFAYMGPYFDDKEPLEHNWINRKDSHNFKALVDYQDAYRDKAARFSVGESSNFVLLPLWREGLQFIRSLGEGYLQEHNTSLLSRFSEQWKALGYDLNPRSAPHLFGLDIPESIETDELARMFKANNVHVSLRGNSIRVSLHVFNTESDLEALTRVLEETSVICDG